MMGRSFTEDYRNFPEFCTVPSGNERYRYLRRNRWFFDHNDVFMMMECIHIWSQD